MKLFILIVIFIILIVTIIIINFNINFISTRQVFPYISSHIFGRICCQLTLKDDITTFEDYLNGLNSKKRYEVKKIVKNEYDKLYIKSSKFKLNYIKTLWEFTNKKYSHKLVKKIFHMFLFSLLFLTNELNYWEYYDKETDEMQGWSSYFIKDGIYYDFICSPNNINISVIFINSIKYCIENKIKILDMGPTNFKLKTRKFNAELIELY